MRDDIKHAAYAVALGYRLTTGGGRAIDPARCSHGFPDDGLSFERGRVTVWETARGWRVGRFTNEGRFAPPVDGDFHKSLVKALDAGALLFDQEPRQWVAAIAFDGEMWLARVTADTEEQATAQALAFAGQAIRGEAFADETETAGCNLREIAAPFAFLN